MILAQRLVVAKPYETIVWTVNEVKNPCKGFQDQSIPNAVMDRMLFTTEHIIHWL